MRGITLATAGFVILGQADKSFAEAMVVGGKAIDISEAPWTVKLSVGCTGSWIGGRWVLTAKHCTSSSVAYITAGITKKSQATQSSLRTPVKRIIKNPATDISLLELTQDITAAKARPIRPATAADATAGLTAAGRLGRLSGWGQLGQNDNSPDSLHMLDHKIAAKGATNVNYLYYGGAVDGVSQGSCFGDSGGPLAVRDATGTGWIQAGVVSGGSAVCGDSDPDSYGRVSSVEAWIRSSTGGSVAVYPLAEPTLDMGPNHFRLSRSETLELTLTAANGSVARRSRIHFPAGDNVLPSSGLAAGNYLARLKGEKLDWRTRILIDR